MRKSFKTEINPTKEQKTKIDKTIGTCRYVYNFYLAHNKELHNKGEKFLSGKSFSVWLDKEYLPNHPEYVWIEEVRSKSVKRTIENVCTAFTRFFEHESGFPRFKKKEKSDVKSKTYKNINKSIKNKENRKTIAQGVEMSLAKIWKFKERRVHSKKYIKTKDKSTESLS